MFNNFQVNTFINLHTSLYLGIESRNIDAFEFKSTVNNFRSYRNSALQSLSIAYKHNFKTPESFNRCYENATCDQYIVIVGLGNSLFNLLTMVSFFQSKA